MPKDINIHLKTTGAEQTKQQLEGVTQGVKQVGDKTAEMGQKASTASGMFSSLFARFAGPLGVIAVITALVGITRKVAEFFDMVKQRSDEAVRQLEQVAGGFEGIFEALGAFDEKSRQAAMEETYQLFKKKGVPEDIGLPIVKSYIQQFKGLVDSGQLTKEQYQQGLETMLSYGTRHAGAATPDLIQLMGGLGMNQPDQQAAFTRQIVAASQAVNLRDEDIIAAMSKGMLTIKAMGWSPEQALGAVATMAAAAGPNARMRATLPTIGLQAIMAPPSPEKLAYAEVAAAQQAKSAADKAKAEAARTKTVAAKTTADQAEADADAKQLLAEQAIAQAETLAEDPLAFLRTVEERRSIMTRDRFNRLLRDIYGDGGQLAVGGLLEGRKDIPDIIQRAKTAQGQAADRAEEDRFKTTLRSRAAVTKAATREIELNVTDEEKLKQDVREIGKARARLLDRREPVLQRLRQTLTGTNLEAAEAEYGARRQWEESLSEQERKEILDQKILIEGLGEFPGYMRSMTPAEKWNTLTIQEQWEALTRPGPVVAPIPGVNPPAIEGPPIPSVPPPANEGTPTSQYFDNRIINYEIHNPVSGMNKQDLGIEPPYLA
jgi:hypothetical protein